MQGDPLVFAPFESATDSWLAEKQLILNLRVSDLTRSATKLRASGIAVITDPQWNDPKVGWFARIHDPEGNAIEWWEPPGRGGSRNRTGGLDRDRSDRRQG